MRRYLGLAAIVSLLSGCGTVFPYNSTSTCPQIGEGVCASAREVYNVTNTKSSVDAADVRSSLKGKVPATEDIVAARAATPSVISGPTIPTQTGAESIIPLRTPSVVMRIWIAPWETDSGDLVLSGYVFTELHERRWQIGAGQISDASSLRPVDTLAEVGGGQASDSGVQPRPAGGPPVPASTSRVATGKGSDDSHGFFQQ
jgi:conjugal transfer pilus assembly protein TraV